MLVDEVTLIMKAIEYLWLGLCGGLIGSGIVIAFSMNGTIGMGLALAGAFGFFVWAGCRMVDES